ncbi:MAG: hypothetical protein BalsKO_07370 [Balneolaceae bacterium]
MPYSKRQIVEVEFPINGRLLPHPAVILSVEKVYKDEGFYLACLITSTTVRDKFSFVLDDDDVTKPFKKQSQVRLHMLFQVYDEDILSDTPEKYLKEESFQRMIDFMDENVFGISYI